MRRVLAIGGGGFSVRPGDPALDRYVLDACERPCPRICLLPTASGDPEDQIHRFYAAYGSLDCEPSDLSLFRLGTRPVDLRRTLLAQDVVYVGGGSMLNLLAVWRAHGLDAILREAWARGTLLCGISAGSMCWFRAGITKGHGRPRAVAGLGLLPFSNSVHYHGEPDRRPVFREAIASGRVAPGFGVDDGVGLLFAGGRLVEAVSARPAAGAWHVDPVERPLETIALGPPPASETPLAISEFRALTRRFA